MKDAVNEVRVDSIKKLLSKLKRIIEYTPKDDAAEIEENKQIIDIVERILEIKKKIQSAQGLKILTPSKMLSRLPISLAQLNAGSNFEKLKNEIRQLLHSLHRSKTYKKITKTLDSLI